MDEAEILSSPPTPPTLPTELLPAAHVAPRSSSPDRVARLQRRVAELEADLEKSHAERPVLSEDGLSASAITDTALQEENDRLTARIATMEADINARVDAARDETDQLSSQLRDSTDALEALRADMDISTKKSAEKFAELEGAMSKLKEENEQSMDAHTQLKIAKAVSDEEIIALKEKLASTTTALETDKKELAQEVDELRLAGQVPFISLVRVHVSDLACYLGNYCVVRGATEQRRGHAVRP